MLFVLHKIKTLKNENLLNLDIDVSLFNVSMLLSMFNVDLQTPTVDLVSISSTFLRVFSYESAYLPKRN
jgi:hypothetical protein